MKSKFNALLLTGALLFYYNALLSQQSDKTTNYRRSSLTMVLLEDNNLGKSKDLVIGAYNSYPFPDKYNLHIIKDNKLPVNDSSITIQEYFGAGFYKDTLKNAIDFLKGKKKHPLNKIKYLNPEKTVGVIEPTKEEVSGIIIDKFIREKQIGKQIVASWFNRDSNGHMDWELLKKRALYSAAEFEKNGGDSKQALTDKLIKDVDVIGNTFIVFHRMEFYENEPVARAIRDAAKEETQKQLAGKPQFLIDKSMKLIDTAYERGKVGYTVKCNTYLYQLRWNEEIAQLTNNRFFNDDINEEKKKSMWDTTSMYQMEFLGKTTSMSIVTFKIGERRTESQIIDLQVKRTMDNAMAKLQREYEPFRTVSPVYSVNPLSAQIGLKEGVNPGDKYEIIQAEEDKFGILHWKRVGKASVSKKETVWDNRIGAELPENNDSDQTSTTNENSQVKQFTVFKGGNKASQINFLRFTK